MHSREQATYVLSGCTAAAVGHTLVTGARPRDTLAGLALLTAADRYYEAAAAPPGPSPRDDAAWRPHEPE
ncbi:hypothetical protein [Halosegnis sp.]|uniref:hypothetical protein n=1 Tax=Halosegnis sp. TaxID=2864959 RepID=UPI0035D416E8